MIKKELLSKEFTCWYEITNENYERIYGKKQLRVRSTSLSDATDHFHNIVSDRMSVVDGADDYFITEICEVQ